MNIVAAQIEVIPANPMVNADKIIESAKKAKKLDKNVDMVVFPELTIPGYLIGDLWEEKSFINECKTAENLVRQAAIDIGLYIVFGNVCVRPGKQHDGRIKKYNSLIIASPNNDENEPFGYIKDIHGDWFIPKFLSPNYREFEEPRHFSNFTDTDYIQPINIRTYSGASVKYIKIGFSICEDGWDEDYDIKVNALLAKRGAKLLVNCSCSPFTLGKNDKRNRVFGGHAKSAGIPLLYVNAIGCQNNGKGVFVFDGSSVLYNSEGLVVFDLGMFKEKLFVFSTEYLDSYQDSIPEVKRQTTDIEEAYQALVYGIKKYCEQSGIEKVVIGSSGGIDSAVSACLFKASLGSENVYLVNMPSEFNSKTTKALSYKLAQNLGCPYAIVSIQDSISLTKNQIDGLEFKFGYNNTETVHLSDFNMENVQARDRSSRILAAIASGLKGRAIFSCNANKTEALISYTTLMGDAAGGLAPLVDLWKTEGDVNIYSLGRYINKLAGKTIIPEDIFLIVASAELSNNQNIDEGKGDPIIYPYHDRLFKSWIQDWNRKSPEEILEWYIDGTIKEKLNLPMEISEIFKNPEEFVADLEKWWKQFKGIGVVKRIQSPPGIVISKRGFGDFKESLNCLLFTTKYKDMKKNLLKI